ncbi:hypothetical protein SARC_03332 [Sphaeroforma arctica JP610]|uniref:DET1- and DDB1-associated protein 1 domain-containing protein n=1 Tax=Sphaeroforma arctica JP610 TaxID=667725 RepID=A0A0L0G6D1_9EUKA|nr:hypothetical protein SARC_03332 [Sphaeroforma arctica JP610]KNC84436.1 hypothetical protein SARC_03332 [Sphaeroforma arctica JP610]|eukprot:XP_014158338.1 hypothetical protein SARC_03332 [Sphaeroforma arctica JP610]
MGSLLQSLPSFNKKNFSAYDKGHSRVECKKAKTYVPLCDTSPQEGQIIHSDPTNLLLKKLNTQFQMTSLVSSEEDSRKRNLQSAQLDSGEGSSGTKHTRVE